MPVQSPRRSKKRCETVPERATLRQPRRAARGIDINDATCEKLEGTEQLGSGLRRAMTEKFLLRMLLRVL